MIKQSLVHAANAEARQESATERLDRIQIPTDISPSEKQPEVFNVIFKLVNKKKGRHWLDNCSTEVTNPDTGNPERLWLLSGASDVWESKVEHILKDKSRYDRARRGMDITFLDGILRVRNTDTLRLKFLRLHPKNVGDRKIGALGSDFYEYSPAKEQQERQQKQLLKIEMVLKAKELSDKDPERMKKIASYLGIPFVDELGMAITPDGIATELMIRADNDPVTFQKCLDSREVEVSYMVKRAIIDNKIDLGGESRNATWANGKGYISKIPPIRKPYEYLTELALTNSDEGRRFLEQLKTFVA
jgi:hypothetical protein